MRKLVASCLFAGVAASAVVTAVPAGAVENTNLENIRPNCVAITDGAQDCMVYSPSMDAEIKVTIRPSLTENNPKVVQFLDGIETFNDINSWITGGQALPNLAEADATLVFPVAPTGSYYADWDDSTGLNWKWETFLTQELPSYLETTFAIPGGGLGHTGVTGISMGGYAAVNLAAKYPHLYTSVFALSGFYNSQLPIGRALIALAPGVKNEDLLGKSPYVTEDQWIANNPVLNLSNLTMPVIITTATGAPSAAEIADPNATAIVTQGSPLEAGTAIITAGFQATAIAAGRDNIEFHYQPLGAHSWHTWLDASWNQGLMNKFIGNIA
ncbi:MAG: alpha/beta hydrolase family protein [Corynebacterium sp.]|nr:alpha/beta hydrolase family protein [Corynebacterium sp.]